MVPFLSLNSSNLPILIPGLAIFFSPDLTPYHDSGSPSGSYPFNPLPSQPFQRNLAAQSLSILTLPTISSFRLQLLSFLLELPSALKVSQRSKLVLQLARLHDDYLQRTKPYNRDQTFILGESPSELLDVCSRAYHSRYERAPRSRVHTLHVSTKAMQTLPSATISLDSNLFTMSGSRSNATQSMSSPEFEKSPSHQSFRHASHFFASHGGCDDWAVGIQVHPNRLTCVLFPQPPEPSQFIQLPCQMNFPHRRRQSSL